METLYGSGISALKDYNLNTFIHKNAADIT